MTLIDFGLPSVEDQTNKKFLALLTIFLLLSSSASYLFANSAYAQTDNSTTSAKGVSCDCVVFRLDDVNSNYLPTVQVDILNEFISKNQSLSLGLIMHRVDPASPVTKKVEEGKQQGLFELDLHGWDHVDYSQLGPEEQLGTLKQANSKLHTIFGQYSQVFIPPYNKFDGDTIGILKPVGIRIFSADTSSDKTTYFVQNGKEAVQTSSLYHLPAMATFKSDNGNGTWIKVPLSTILTQIDNDVARYGYSVVLLHPQNFAKMENNAFVDTTDPNEIHDISSLMDSIKSKNLHITTFAGVTGLNPHANSSSHIPALPEFQGMESVALAVSILMVIGLAVASKRDSVLNRF